MSYNKVYNIVADVVPSDDFARAGSPAPRYIENARQRSLNKSQLQSFNPNVYHGGNNNNRNVQHHADPTQNRRAAFDNVGPRIHPSLQSSKSYTMGGRNSFTQGQGRHRSLPNKTNNRSMFGLLPTNQNTYRSFQYNALYE
eukprot:UN04702